MTKEYELIEHSYDVVVVGAGGAGLRAAIKVAEGRTRIWDDISAFTRRPRGSAGKTISNDTRRSPR